MAQSFERFGKYILLEKLASGGMAEVYLAKNTGAIGVSKFVAIKRILPQYSDNEEFIEMFKEEAKIAVNLNHSNVVHIHEFGIEKNQFFLVMEYVEGKNLRQVVNELKKKANSFQIDQVVYIIKEVAAGLDHAHRCLDGTTGKPLNITHRDMSPQNVMVSFEGEVKIIDFGIAKAENQMEATKAGTLKGKFGYMSPEQAEGQNIDLRTDIFSLGIVLWELLAKDRLFSGSSEAAILRKIRECVIPSLRKIDPTIHPELEKICNKALAKDKNLRYQTGGSLHRDLNRFLNTHYPEFSSQDFSVFIKHAFADTYSEQKGKLVEFSNVQIPEPIEGIEPNTITRVNAKYKEGQSDPNPSTVKNLSPNTPPPPMLPNLDMNSGSEEKIELLELNSGVKNQLNFKSGGEEDSKVMTKSYKSSLTNNLSKKTRHTKINKKSSFNPNLVYTLLFIVVGSLGYYFMYKFTPGWKNSSSNEPPPLKISDPTEPTTPVRPQLDTTIPASVMKKNNQRPTLPVHIDSNPPFAEVYIEGENMGRTPIKLDLEADKNLKFSLRLNKYTDVDKTIRITSRGQTIKEILTEVRYGYLIINALNAGAQYTIKINDKTSPDYLMRQQIQVPAETTLKVEVTNSLGFKAIQEISVKENTRQTIEMILKKIN